MIREKFLPAIEVDPTKATSRSVVVMVFAISGLFIGMFLLSYGFTKWTIGQADVQQPFGVLARALPFDPDAAFVDPNQLNATVPRCPDFAAYAAGGGRAAVPAVRAGDLLEHAHAARDTRAYDLMSACMRAAMNVSRPDDEAFAGEMIDEVPARGPAYLLALLAARGVAGPLRVAIEMNPANVREAVVRWRAGESPHGPGDYWRACDALFALGRFPYDMFVSSEECGNSMGDLALHLAALFENLGASNAAETYEYFHAGAANDTRTYAALQALLGANFTAELVAGVQDEVETHRAEIESLGKGVPDLALLPHWTVHLPFLSALANYTDGIAAARWRVFAQTALLLDGMQLAASVMHDAPPSALVPGTNVTEAIRDTLREKCAWLAMNYLPRQSSALVRTAFVRGDTRPTIESVRAAFVRWLDRSPLDPRTRLEFARKVHGLRVVDGSETPGPLDGARALPPHPSLHRAVSASKRAALVRVLAEGHRAAPMSPSLDARAPVRYVAATNTLEVSGVAGVALFRPGWPRAHVMGTLGFETARALLGMASEGALAYDHKGQLDHNFALASFLYSDADVAAAEIALLACDDTAEEARQLMLALAQHLADEPGRVNNIAGSLKHNGAQPWCQ